MTISRLALCAALLVSGCAGQKALMDSPAQLSEKMLAADRAQAQQQITADGLLAHIKVLSSDAFEGRKPGTAGEDATVDYLIQQFKALKLYPGSQQGSYVQPVNLIGITGEASLKLTAKGKSLPMKQGEDYVAASARFLPDVDVKNAPLVFVGYGVQAPEYNWDDYKGVDVRGKTLVMLINDPPVPDANHPAQLDAALFSGKA